MSGTPRVRSTSSDRTDTTTGHWVMFTHARSFAPSLWSSSRATFREGMSGRLGRRDACWRRSRSDHRIDAVFQRLDQVRWERGTVDASDLETESDLMCRADDMFDDLLASEQDTDVMLAVRVIFGGTTSLHGRLHADADRWIAAVRSLATEKGGDRLWIEKVELRVQPRACADVA